LETDQVKKAYNSWLKAVGRCIAARRKELSWTQAVAAKECEMDFKFYQDLEYGRRPCSTRTLFNVAIGLKTHIYYLFPRPDEFLAPVQSRVTQNVTKSGKRKKTK